MSATNRHIHQIGNNVILKNVTDNLIGAPLNNRCIKYTCTRGFRTTDGCYEVTQKRRECSPPPLLKCYQTLNMSGALPNVGNETDLADQCCPRYRWVFLVFGLSCTIDSKSTWRHTAQLICNIGLTLFWLYAIKSITQLKLSDLACHVLAYIYIFNLFQAARLWYYALLVRGTHIIIIPFIAEHIERI